MIALSVQITRYISDDPQPGVVECRLFDAYGNEWIFLEKTAIVSSLDLTADADYPQPGVIACEIIEQWQDVNGKEIASVNTERPWRIETLDGVSRFDVLRSQIIEVN
jgi:uncharacterized protein YodC (DUF2158 family)